MGSSDDVFPGFTTCFDGDANPLADEGRFVLLGVRAVSLGLNGALSDVTFILSLDGVVTNFVAREICFRQHCGNMNMESN